jgi:hypothetical protein
MVSSGLACRQLWGLIGLLFLGFSNGLKKMGHHIDTLLSDLRKAEWACLELPLYFQWHSAINTSQKDIILSISIQSSKTQRRSL